MRLKLQQEQFKLPEVFEVVQIQTFKKIIYQILIKFKSERLGNKLIEWIQVQIDQEIRCRYIKCNRTQSIHRMFRDQQDLSMPEIKE